MTYNWTISLENYTHLTYPVLGELKNLVRILFRYGQIDVIVPGQDVGAAVSTEQGPAVQEVVDAVRCGQVVKGLEQINHDFRVTLPKPALSRLELKDSK